VIGRAAGVAVESASGKDLGEGGTRMSGRIDWNIVTLGRVLGVVIIVLGIFLAALDATALRNSNFSSLGSHYRLRFFLHGVIDYLWRGGLVIVAAEIAARLGWGQDDEHEPTDESLPASD
jgi:hypothetical protein